MPDEHMDKKQEEQLINSTMVTSVDQAQAYRIFFSQRLKYPFLRGKIGELEPNVFFSYSDHPLDINGTALTQPFTALRKNRGRKACCILSVTFHSRAQNSFIFRASGYNIFKIINLNAMSGHEYLVTDKTPHQDCTLQIDFLRADAYRLRLALRDSVPANQTPMLHQDITDPDAAILMSEDPEKYTLASERLKLCIYKTRFRIDIFNAEGNQVTESGSQTKNEFSTQFDAFPMGFIRDNPGKKTYAVDSFVLYPGEAIFGLGEHFKPVNKVGQTVGMWNHEGLGNTSGRVYKNIPFFMSTQGYGVFINESRPITFWVGTRETCRNEFAVEADFLDYYFFYGPSFQSILDTYTNLTGKPAMPPLWSFGTWMSRISYYSQEQVMAVAKRLRDMKFPMDVIHIDTGWFKKDWQCDWKFDPLRFPDPAGMFKAAHEMGFRICLWQIPYVLEGTDIYPEARKKGVLAKNNSPYSFLFMFLAHVIDFSNPEAVTWYQQLLSPLLEMGADSIKSDFGEQVEPPMQFKHYDGRRMHNLFPLLYQKAAFEVIQQKKGVENAVIWARSAYAGAQRYPVHWSGDNSSNLENLPSSLRGGLSLGLCGFTFWSQDTGGFVGVPSEEYYIRAVEVSIFQSHMRFHGNPPQYKEPWYFSKETQDIVRRYLELRYQLIPYLYSESSVAASKGLPVLRHLVIEFQDDPTVYHIEDQFLCGRYLLVAPILTRNSSRNVYLPDGTWFDFWTGKPYKGRQWITITARLDQVPVFVRAGMVLPLARVVQCTDELSFADMTLKVYPDATGGAAYELFHSSGSFRMSAATQGKDLHTQSDPGLSNPTWEVADQNNTEFPPTS